MMCRKFNIPCVEIHSLMKQKLRISALANFKSSQVKVLFATDVASRGLDIPTVDLVINENVPHVPKEYVHRGLNFDNLYENLLHYVTFFFFSWSNC
jgi:ATP-dependent RNA helicase DDX49/DBP8